MAGHHHRLALIKNSFFSVLTASSSVLLLLLFLFAARILGVEALGTLSLGIAIGNAVAFILDLGVNAISIRRISSSDSSPAEAAAHLLVWRLLVVLLFLVLFLPGVWWFVESPLQRNTIMIFSVAGAFRCINLSFRALFQAINRFSTESMVVFVDTLSIILVGILILHQGGGPIELALTFLGVRGTITFIYLGLTLRFIRDLKWRVTWAGMWDLQKEGFPLGVAVMCSAVFWQIDIILLSALASAYATGIFSAGYRIIEGAKVGPDSLANAFYPRLSYYQATEVERFDDLLARGCKYVLIVGGGVSCMGILFASELIDFLYGDEYLPSVQVFAVLATIPLIYFLGQFLLMGLRSLGLQKAIMAIQIIALLVKVLLGVPLIVWFGVQGAVIAAVGGAITFTAMALVMICKARYQSKVIIKQIGPIVIAASIALGFGYLFAGLLIVFKAILVGLIYLLCLYGLRVFDAYELHLVSKLSAKIVQGKRS